MLTTFHPEAFFGFEETVHSDLENPLDVFRHFFHRELPPQIHILPSENCLYFVFTAASNRPYRGCMSISRRRSHENGVSFSYLDRETLVGKYIFLDSAHGLRVQWLDNFTLEVTFEGRSRLVFLNRLTVRPPARAVLRNTESYLGPCHDEYGLSFALCFDTETRCFFWLLDDSSEVPETFVRHNGCLEFGARSKFIFLDDRQLCRRILIGVSAAEMRANNYYDGPFDQLPDNHIKNGEVELRKYIELNDPDRRYQLDEFGYFKMLKGRRVAITASCSYETLDQLTAIAESYEDLGACDEFYANLFYRMDKG